MGTRSLTTSLLEAGWVYLLTAKAPSVAPGVGPGPAVAPATTVGEFLFTEIGELGGRGMVLLVPRIASDLYPEALASVEVTP